MAKISDKVTNEKGHKLHGSNTQSRGTAAVSIERVLKEGAYKGGKQRTGISSTKVGRTREVIRGEKKRVSKTAITATAIAAANAEGHGIYNVRILANASDKPESRMTPLEKWGIVRAGVDKIDLEHLKIAAKLDYDTLAKALSVTRATLINKKQGEKFNAAVSDRIVGLADIYSYGYEVFEDTDRFNQWMFRPNQALGGQAPYELLDNQFGREEVRNMIGRIDYGVYS